MTNKARTIALVDDHASFREVACRFLTSLGYKVVLEAADGMELLHSLQACSPLPDACILDIEMPVMDGLATAYALRERYPGIKVVALTVSRDEQKRDRMMKAGVLGVLFKGMDEDELTKGLFGLLGS
jgi:DNA-binding NarL/FixJ family response regulator